MKEAVRFSKEAKRLIANEFEKYPDVETGGVLLGYFSKSYSKVVRAVAGGEKAVREPGSFEYDSRYVEDECNKVSDLYSPPLELVGLWHKHNHILEPAFSKADIDMHSMVLNDGRGISCLFQKKCDGSYQLQIMIDNSRDILLVEEYPIRTWHDTL